MTPLKKINGTLGLVIPNRMEIALDMPGSFNYRGWPFSTMTEYYAPVIYTRRHAPLVAHEKKISPAAAEQMLLDCTERLHQDNPMDFGMAPIDVRWLKKDGDQSIVIMAVVEGMTSFYQELNEELELGIPVPPTFVTLYTVKGTLPLEVLSEDEMRKFHQQLNPQEAKALETLALYGR